MVAEHTCSVRWLEAVIVDFDDAECSVFASHESLHGMVSNHQAQHAQATLCLFMAINQGNRRVLMSSGIGGTALLVASRRMTKLHQAA